MPIHTSFKNVETFWPKRLSVLFRMSRCFLCRGVSKFRWWQWWQKSCRSTATRYVLTYRELTSGGRSARNLLVGVYNATYCGYWFIQNLYENRSSIVTSFCMILEWMFCDNPYVVIIVRWMALEVWVVVRKVSRCFRNFISSSLFKL